MSYHELFEKDYLAAFPKPANPHLNHWDYAYRIWLQQAKRHEAEIAELAAALNRLVENAEGFSVSGVYFNESAENRKALDDAYDAVAKYEVKS